MSSSNSPLLISYTRCFAIQFKLFVLCGQAEGDAEDNCNAFRLIACERVAYFGLSERALRPSLVISAWTLRVNLTDSKWSLCRCLAGSAALAAGAVRERLEAFAIPGPGSRYPEQLFYSYLSGSPKIPSFVGIWTFQDIEGQPFLARKRITTAYWTGHRSTYISCKSSPSRFKPHWKAEYTMESSSAVRCGVRNYRRYHH